MDPVTDRETKGKLINLRLFGAPRLLVKDEEIQLGRRKATALLAYLAVTKMSFRREELATLLWPESPADAAYAALRNALWIIRQSPLDSVLVADRSTIRIDSDAIDVDVTEFRGLIRGCGEHGDRALGACLACEANLRQAIELVSAPLLSGFTLPDAVQFDDWQISEREALRRELLDALERLVVGYRDRGEWSLAAEYARRWVQEDRLSEEGWRELMRAEATQGRRAEAIRCYDQCAENLASDLGVVPDVATTALADRIRSGEFAPATIPAAGVPDNLPVSATTFVGRKEEIAQIRQQLTGDGPRLVSLVGLGGSGKTRLAIEAAHELKPMFPDGVFFVPLGEIAGEAAVATAISSAIRKRPPRNHPTGLAGWLRESLRGKRMLLVLDEAEGIQDGTRLLATLLETADAVHLLVTSRSALGLTTESTVPVHGLRYPEVADADIAEHEAIQLLRLAARRVDPAHVPSPRDLVAMARVARLVDGAPLGLELAAAWTRLLSWERIAARFEEDPDFLAGEQEDLPERHRSLRAVFDQTWALLEPGERKALTVMTLFVEGFTPEAAEKVVGCSPATLASLSAKNIIRRTGPERYRLHALIRQFVSEADDSGTPAEDAWRNYIGYYMGFVENAFVEMKGPRQREALDRLRDDMGNVRRAWLSAAERGMEDMARRAAIGMFFFFDMLTLFEEGEEVFAQAHEALARAKGEQGLLQGFLLVACGWFAHFTALETLQERIQGGLGVLDHEPWSAVRALSHVIGAFAGVPSDREDLAQRLQQSIGFYEERGDDWELALALEARGVLLSDESPKEAHDLVLRSLELRRGLGDRWGQALALFVLAGMAENQGRLGQADVRYEQSQKRFEEISDDLYGVIDCLTARARVAMQQGDLDASAKFVRETLELCSRTSNSWRHAMALREAGKLEWRVGNYDLGRQRLEEALELYLETGGKLGASACAAWLGDLCAEIGDRHRSEGWYQESLSMNPENKRAQRGLETLRTSSESPEQENET